MQAERVAVTSAAATGTGTGTAVGTEAAVYLGASQDAIGMHYDQGNEFFALWLDETLTYSCALWSEEPAVADAEPLQTAQLRKLDLFAVQAGIGPGSAVLDVGCGWGGMLRRATTVHGAASAHGLTLAQEQAEWIGKQDWAGCSVDVVGWADFRPATEYDALVSIGAFEHFAREGLARPKRVAAYRDFFAWCHQALRPGGRLALQTNTKGGNVRLDRATAAELRFICERMFPESELPWLSEILEASERLFHPRLLRNDPDHYARTCARWLANLRARRAEAVALVGAEVVEEHEHYLSATVGHFERRHLSLARLVFDRM